MAAVGSAVGLGNVWRFPYVCYKNGGGAFLIPYFVALFTAGIPLMILEFSLGHWTRNPPPNAFKKVNKKMEWIGWWSSLVPFVVALYYVVVMAWCFSYMVYSVDLRWSGNPEGFFLNNYLGITSGPLSIGGFRVPVLLGLIAIWVSVFLILYKGVKRIGKVVAITVPLPTILLIILTIRGLTLPGAMNGVEYYLAPDFSKLFNVNSWLAAYAQVFFSLGVAQGIMITYSSFLPKKSDINNNAFITSLLDSGTSFLAGFAVFSVVGYLAMTQGVGIDQLGIAGPFLTFITYPTAISLLPFAASIFGFIFYIALLTFGIDSAFSMLEPMVSSLNAKWRITKGKSTAIMCLIGFVLSLFFATGSGLYWLDIVDHFIANFGLVTVGLIECIVLGYGFRLYKLRLHANARSEIKIGKWWDFLIKIVSPIILITLLIFAVLDNLKTPYMNYPVTAIIVGGILPCLLAIVISFILMKKKDIGRGEGCL